MKPCAAVNRVIGGAYRIPVFIRRCVPACRRALVRQPAGVASIHGREFRGSAKAAAAYQLVSCRNRQLYIVQTDTSCAVYATSIVLFGCRLGYVRVRNISDI